MEGKAAYSFSTSGDSEQAVGFDCAQTETQRAERTAMARMQEPRLDDCSAAENWRSRRGRHATDIHHSWPKILSGISGQASPFLVGFPISPRRRSRHTDLVGFAVSPKTTTVKEAPSS